MFGLSQCNYKNLYFGNPHFLSKTKSTRKDIGHDFEQGKRNSTGLLYISETIQRSLWVRDELFAI